MRRAINKRDTDGGERRRDLQGEIHLCGLAADKGWVNTHAATRTITMTTYESDSVVVSLASLTSSTASNFVKRRHRVGPSMSAKPGECAIREGTGAFHRQLPTCASDELVRGSRAG